MKAPLGTLLTFRLLVLLLIATLSGCGRSKPEGPSLYPVTGTVTFKGKPLPKANIVFIPLGKGQMAAGRTDDNGQFAVTYSDGRPGAVAGTHRVEIRTGGEILDPEGRIVSEFKEFLPEKYHSNSQLSAEVAANQGPINFDLAAK
ncbi:carboxypeptidase-like regulatory domain-containing protein [Planctomicrobium piriforme]|uniref:Carboxypeptidase regulatory-like domain-containing protein n=1 Tax=Planctomicrobium piriforme TaxID=1576369 RepID=A0A1I3IYR9_9PLAN|nr:carboxypeptidase-like regulatory domain-containing protein [Planctomicrobium piriforme]SFI53124.1 hypothetical protein SAMN05421753_1102 [Planctomicrobium piriforme]